MIIGISGVSSTGKSSLAKAAAEKLNLPVLLDTDWHERAWKWLEEKGLMPHTKFFPELTPEEHINFERAAVSSRIAMENEQSEFIGDETPLEYINYLYLTCAPYPNLISPTELNVMIDALRSQLRRYDLIWYLPFGQLPVVDDGRRLTNEHLLKGLDYRLRGMMQELIELQHPIIGIINDITDLETRVKIVLTSPEIIKQNKQRKKIN
jgi:hypothetical protein